MSMVLLSQEKNAVQDPEERKPVPMSKEEAQQRSLRAFQKVLDNGSKIVLDHHLVYFTREFLSNRISLTCLMCSRCKILNSVVFSFIWERRMKDVTTLS